jgi:hypothetical protein
MAVKSLTATPSSNNDISILAKLLEGNFKYHRKNPSPNEDYIKNLKAIVGLGFIGIMVDGSFISTYRPYFNKFLDYCSSSQCNSISPISLEAARILEKATCVFPKYDYQDYYQVFENSFKKIVKSGLLDSSEIAKEDNRLIKLMLSK